MTIRLRLTLIYSAILALTLVVFGVALYSVQAQDTLNSLKQDLVASSRDISGALLRNTSRPPMPELDSQTQPPPKPFEEFSNAQEFQGLREREIVRVLDAEGNLVASPFGRSEDALPLSDEALVSMQQGVDWYETGVVTEEDMLIYSHPVMVDGELAAIVQVARSLTERNRSLQSLTTTLVISGAIMIFIAFMAGWFLSGLALHPIDRMTQTAKEIGDDRDFTRRVEYTGKQDEVGRLAMTFNQMLGQLQNAFQKVEHSLQQQQNFVADVSHELRTPLTTLRGNLGLLLKKPPAPAEMQEDILTDMVDESDRMIRLVNDLLMMAHADAGRSLMKEKIEVGPVLEYAVNQAGKLDVHREIQLDLSEDLAMIGDSDALKQILLILLDNAMKYSSDAVDITCSRHGSWIRICVRDYGEGIAPDELKHVFDRFYRSEENSFLPGFGLGLSIAKALVEAMAGEILIESELDKGTAVTISFTAV